MAQGGFNLRKWMTNSRPLMEKVKGMESQREFSIQKELTLTELRSRFWLTKGQEVIRKAGELFVKTVFGREIEVSKEKICLFTCGSTRSIHIELNPSLTTQAFIRCLRRFVARIGIPELVISDNAKTFKAAATQLRRIFNDLAVMSFLLKRKIQWKFNLEKVPWWGVGG